MYDCLAFPSIDIFEVFVHASMQQFKEIFKPNIVTATELQTCCT